MPVGLVRKWTLVATAAAAIGMIGCKDDGDDDPPPNNQADTGTPGGGSDSGTPGGGGMDSGTDAGRDGGADTGTPGPTYEAGMPCPGWDGGPITCGTKTCFWHRTTLTCANPGCIPVGDASICGIDTNSLGGVEAGLPALLPFDAPGADSTACGELGDSWEVVPDGGAADGGSKGNGLIDTTRSVSTPGGAISVFLRYPGCCTTAGYCSGHTGKGMGALAAGGTPMFNPSNAGYGCLNHQVFYGTNAAAVPTRCDSTSGVLVDGGATTDGGNTDAGAGDSGGASDASADGGNG